jgi:hypothetical protein
MNIVFIFTYPESIFIPLPILCCITYVLHTALLNMLTFSIQPFECQVSAAAGVLFNLNVRHRTVFPYWNAKDVHLMGQLCPVHLLVVKNEHFSVIIYPTNLQSGCDLIILVSVLDAVCLKNSTGQESLPGMLHVV